MNTINWESWGKFRYISISGFELYSAELPIPFDECCHDEECHRTIHHSNRSSCEIGDNNIPEKYYDWCKLYRHAWFIIYFCLPLSPKIAPHTDPATPHCSTVAVFRFCKKIKSNDEPCYFDYNLIVKNYPLQLAHDNRVENWPDKHPLENSPTKGRALNHDPREDVSLLGGRGWQRAVRNWHPIGVEIPREKSNHCSTYINKVTKFNYKLTVNVDFFQVCLPTDPTIMNRSGSQAKPGGPMIWDGVSGGKPGGVDSLDISQKAGPRTNLEIMAILLPTEFCDWPVFSGNRSEQSGHFPTNRALPWELFTKSKLWFLK